MLDITGETFEAYVLKSTNLTLVDFWAPWCPWCRVLLPVLNKIEKEYSDKLVFSTLNIAEYPDLAQKYGVLSLPTMLFFYSGRVVGEVVGYLSEEKLKNEFSKILSRYKESLAQSSSINSI